MQFHIKIRLCLISIRGSAIAERQHRPVAKEVRPVGRPSPPNPARSAFYGPHFCQLVNGFTRVVVTSRVSRRPRKKYCGHARVCLSVLSVCLSVYLSAAACSHYCTDPDVTWSSGRGCPLVVHYWADLQSVHGMRCYGNIMEMRGRAQR